MKNMKNMKKMNLINMLELLLHPKYLTNITHYILLFFYLINDQKWFLQVLPMLWTNSVLGIYIFLFYIDKVIERHKKYDKLPLNFNRFQKELFRLFSILYHLVPTYYATKLGIKFMKHNKFPMFSSLITIMTIAILYLCFQNTLVYGKIPYNIMFIMYVPITILSIQIISELK